MSDSVQNMYDYIMELGGNISKATTLMTAILVSHGTSKAAENRKQWDRDYRKRKRLKDRLARPPDPTRPHPTRVDDGIYVEPMVTSVEVKELPVKQVMLNQVPVKSGAREAAIVAEFEVWFGKYPRKIDRTGALKAYKKIRKTIAADQLLDFLEIYNLSLPPNQDKQYIPYPAKWLNNRRWEDEHAGNHSDYPDTSTGRSQAREATLVTSLGNGALKHLEKFHAAEPKVQRELPRCSDATGEADLGITG